MSRFALALAFAALSSTAVQADVIHLTNGRTIEGRSTHTPKGLRVDHRYGTVLIPHDQVAEVEEKETPEEVYARRVKGLKADDLAGTLALAAYCVEAELLDEARGLLLERALRLNPKAPRLHALLGRIDYHLVGGKWLPPHVYYPAQGYERIDGKWLPPVRARVVKASRALKAREQDREASSKNLSYARSGLRSAEARIDRAEERLEELLAEQVGIGARVEGARVELRRREQDLDYARAQALEAVRQRDAWLRGPCGCADLREKGHGPGCQWDRRLRRLRQRVLDTADAATRAEQGRDETSECLQDLLEREALLPGRVVEQRQEIAQAKVDLPKARARQQAAQRAHEQAVDALDRARNELIKARAAKAAAARKA